MKINIVINVPDNSSIHINGKSTNPPYGLERPHAEAAAPPEATVELPDLTGMTADQVAAIRDDMQHKLAQIAAARAIWEYHLAYLLGLAPMA